MKELIPALKSLLAIFVVSYFLVHAFIWYAIKLILIGYVVALLSDRMLTTLKFSSKEKNY